jgi:DNA-binding beta-propeller fold protein YncE
MYSLIHHNGWLIVLTIHITILLCACTTQGPVSDQHDTNRDLIWPPAPNKPRIKHIGNLTHPKDLGINKGFLGMLSELALGEEKIGMVHPMAVVENEMDQLYVADPGAKAIHRFDRKGGRYNSIKRIGGKDFESPVSLATDNQGNVYIADSELAQIFIVRSDDNEAVPLALDEDFIRPTGVAIDRDTGWIYVVDTGVHKISVFNQDMMLLKKFGHRGSKDGELNFPTYIWQNRDKHLLVTDSLNFRIQLFDRHGNYLGKFGTPGNAMGNLSRPKGVAEDSHGHIYVVDSLFHNVQLFNASGLLLMHFGKQGSKLGDFWLPAGIFISDDNTIYVCDSYNQRVQIFQYIGEAK